MKSYPIILFFGALFFLISCTNDLTDIGKGIQPASDQIMIGTDTFHLSSKTVFVDSIFSRPDSFLLGTFYDTKFGTVQADILAQVNCPEGFKFPPNSMADSANIMMYYSSCFGDSLAPLDLNIYEMNKQTFSYTGFYPSNINPSDYTDLSLKLGERIIVAGGKADSTKVVKFKMKNDFVQRFFNDSHFNSTDNFLGFFKGIYITANFGASTLLNINMIVLKYYYHYTYNTKNINGGDSTAIVNDYLLFPANAEVRQVNRVLHPNRNIVVNPDINSNYISSPSNLQTRIGLPLNKIQKRLNTGINGKKLTINSAIIKIEVTDTEQDTLLHPIVNYLLIIKESAIDRFFNNNELPSDTCAVLAQYNSTQIGTTGVYEHYYTFNIAKLIANELKISNQNRTTPAETMNLRLVPVSIRTSTNSSGTSSITSVKQQYLMNAVTIRSGNNSTSPMRINLVYSGF
jgi:hypothetical protein